MLLYVIFDFVLLMGDIMEDNNMSFVQVRESLIDFNLFLS